MRTSWLAFLPYLRPLDLFLELLAFERLEPDFLLELDFLRELDFVAITISLKNET